MGRSGSLLAAAAMLVGGSPCAADPGGAAVETAVDAERCLATAIYYEAAHEPLAGREAVAEVILNRRASGRYPATVCGVVYQGSTRSTGCQFTFTCDGSLRRVPDAALYAAAEAVARRALAGGIAPRLGGALNYHASYVSPVWSKALTRTATIGLHIFYRGGKAGAAAPADAPVPVAAAPGPPAGLSVWGIPLSRFPAAAPRMPTREVAALDPVAGAAE